MRDVDKDNIMAGGLLLKQVKFFRECLLCLESVTNGALFAARDQILIEGFFLGKINCSPYVKLSC